jgi:hypothetical protein
MVVLSLVFYDFTAAVPWFHSGGPQAASLAMSAFFYYDFQ